MDNYIQETYKHSQEYLKLLCQFCFEQHYFLYFQPRNNKIIISAKVENTNSLQLEVNDVTFFENYRLWLGEHHEPSEYQDDEGEYYESPFSEEDYYLEEIDLKQLPSDTSEKLALFIWEKHSDKDFCSFCSSEFFNLRLDHIFKLTNNGILSEEKEYEFISHHRLSLNSFLSKNKIDAQTILKNLNNQYANIHDYVVELLKYRSCDYKVKLLKSYPKNSFFFDTTTKDFLFNIFNDSSTRNHYFSQLYEPFPYLEKFVEPIPVKKENTIEINVHLSQFSIEGLYYFINPKGVSSYHIEEHFNYLQKYLNQKNLKNYLSQIGIEHFYVFKPNYDELNCISHFCENSKINIDSWENLLINSIKYIETKEIHEHYERKKELIKSPLYQYLTTSLLEICLDNKQLKSSKKMKV